jgi:hypothetical protein
MSTNMMSVYLGAGVAASRPATPAIPGVGFYWATDTNVLSVWTSAAWTTVGTVAPGTSAVLILNKLLTAGTAGEQLEDSGVLWAQTGLVADDNYHIQVTSNGGSTWIDALTVRNTDGGVDFVAAIDTVASATTTDIGATTSLKVSITGTATITSFGSHIHKLRFVSYQGAVTLTNGANLVLLGGANRVAAVGDLGIYTSSSTGIWTERAYFRADGTPICVGEITNLPADTAPDPAADTSAHYSNAGTAIKQSLLGRSPNMAKSAAVTGSASLTSTSFFKTNIVDASGGAAVITLPASATADDWIGIRKGDSSANTVTVQNSSAVTIAILGAQGDWVDFAWWSGAWTAFDDSIAPQLSTITSSTTYTVPPLAKYLEVIVIQSGAGGGSGRRGATSTGRSGGQGGKGGAVTHRIIPVSLVGASATVTIGAGGTSGAAQTVDSTDGNAGGNGGSSSFVGTSFNVSTGASVGGSAGSNAVVNAASGVTASDYGGAIGITASSVTAAVGNPASAVGGGTGGTGGGITTGNVDLSGAVGGTSSVGSSQLAGGTAGAASGGSGGNGSPTVALGQMGGSGAGAGAGNSTGAGGTGGNGGIPGGGGGGGGASLNGNNSGAGGTGARGEVRVTAYF